jgi:hypothetical protein
VAPRVKLSRSRPFSNFDRPPGANRRQGSTTGVRRLALPTRLDLATSGGNQGPEHVQYGGLKNKDFHSITSSARAMSVAGPHILQLDVSLGIGWIDQHADERGRGHHLVQELKPLRLQFHAEHGNAGYVPSGLVETCHKAELYRVGGHIEDNRNRRCRNSGCMVITSEWTAATIAPAKAATAADFGLQTGVCVRGRGHTTRWRSATVMRGTHSLKGVPGNWQLGKPLVRSGPKGELFVPDLSTPTFIELAENRNAGGDSGGTPSLGH